MTMQPPPPEIPQIPGLSAQDRAEIVQGAREAAQAAREATGRTGQTANASVIKDAGGRIVVTGPSGKTITIDPRAGLNGDQIQEMVQTALQPTPMPGADRPSIPSGAVPLVAIVFTFLFLIALVLSRAIAGRRGAGPTTAALPPESVARLARIEQAVEAVAIEVERISEAQRYSAQLLTDRLSGPAQPTPAIARTVDAPVTRG